MIQGDRLRRLREQAALSQSRLGSLIGQDQQYVSKLERGVLPGMTVETLERLCRALQVSTDYLLDFSCTTTTPTPESGQAVPRRRPRTLSHPHAPDAGSPAHPVRASVVMISPPEPPQPPSATPQTAGVCPYCAIPMQPLGEGAGVACQACRYSPVG